MAGNRRIAVKHTAAGLFMFLLGTIAIVVGGFWYPDTVKERVDKKLVNMVVVESELDENFADWKEASDFGGMVGNKGNPSHRNFYLFNITNLDDVLWGKAKPKLSQCGPYAYVMSGKKFDTHFLPGKYITYKLHEQLVFSQELSGTRSLDDRITTVNVPYAQILVNLQKSELSEAYMSSRLSFRALSDYKKTQLGEFLAEQKRSALSRYLTRLYANMRYTEISSELSTRVPEILTSTIPATLLSMDARIRTAKIPLLVSKAFRELNILGIWAAVTDFYETVRRKAAPRVISGIYERMKKDEIPVMLGRMQTRQNHDLVPQQLGQTMKRILSLDTPAALKAAFYEVRFDAVPTVIAQLRNEINTETKVKGNIIFDQAVINTATQWRKGSVETDLTKFAKIYDGKIRYGFELNWQEIPNKSPNDGVSQYLLKPTNSFSFLNKDGADGWVIWRALVEGDMSQVDVTIANVDTELVVGINKEEVLWIRDYLKQWISNEITIIDRITAWQTGVNLWGMGGESESAEAQFYGVNRGLQLANTTVGKTITQSAGLYLWNETNAYSFLNPTGWLLWEKAVVGHREDDQAFEDLASKHADLTVTQVREIVAWLRVYQGNKFIVKRARKHWSSAVCAKDKWVKNHTTALWEVDTTTSAPTSVPTPTPTVGGNVTTPPPTPYPTVAPTPAPVVVCEEVDLDENTAGTQGGFEINLKGNPGLVISDKITQYLWNANNKFSFLKVPSSKEEIWGINAWQHACNTSYTRDSTRALLLNQINEAIRISQSDDPVPVSTTTADYITAEQMLAIVEWVEDWAGNVLLKDEMLRRWAHGSCLEPQTAFWKRYEFDGNRSDCTDGVAEYTKPQVFTSATSPFTTTNVTQITAKTTCYPFDRIYPYVEIATEVQLIKFIDERAAVTITKFNGGLPVPYPQDKYYFTYTANGTDFYSAPILVDSDAATVKAALEAMTFTEGPFTSFGSVTVVKKTITAASSKIEEEYTITFDDQVGQTVGLLTRTFLGSVADVILQIGRKVEGGTFNKQNVITFYNRTIHTNYSQTESYSCDIIDTEPLVDGHQPGWEPNPSRAATIPALPSAARHYVWDATQTHSFLNLADTGFHLWMKTAAGDTSARNTIVAGAAAGAMSAAQVENVAKWLSSQQSLGWLSYQLRQQWSRVDSMHSVAGTPGLADLDLEPFRAGTQLGWSVALETERSVRDKGGYEILDAHAADLWNASHPLSFLNAGGFRHWLMAGLVLGEECGEFCDKDCMECAAESKTAISTGFEGGSVWKPWMISVGLWVKKTLTHEILVRDILRKWMNDTCFPEVPSPPSIVTSVSNFTNNASACVPGIIAQTEKVDTTYAPFYTDVVYDRNSPHYTKKVLRNITSVACTYTNISRLGPPPPNVTNATNSTIIDVVTTRTISYSSQHIVQYSCDLQDLSTNWEGINAGFELDPQRKKSGQVQVPLDVAVRIFDKTTNITFFTQEGFNMWKDSVQTPAFRAEIISRANHPDFGVTQFEQVLAWLRAWVENPLTKAQFQRLWAVRNKDINFQPLDLDLQQEGIQEGFEVNWFNLPKRSPTTAHAAYLWDPKQKYSFMNPGGIVNGEATGFFAWNQLFEGFHPASTRLVRNADGSYEAQRQYQKANATLVFAIGNETNTLPPCQAPDREDKFFLDVNLTSAHSTAGTAVGGFFSLVIDGARSAPIAYDADAAAMFAALKAASFKTAPNVSKTLQITGVEFLSPPLSTGVDTKNWELRIAANESWGAYNASSFQLVQMDSAGLGTLTVGTGAVDNSTAVVGSVPWSGRYGYNRTDVTRYPCPPRNGLTPELLDQISAWLFSWADNLLLIDLVHEQWAESRYVTQEGSGTLPIAALNFNDQIPTGEQYIVDGFPRGAITTGFELPGKYQCSNATAQRTCYTRPQMRELWNFSNPHSFLHPPGFKMWRNAHRGNAPETGILPSQRVPRHVQAGALRNISVATNTAPDCGANYTNTTVEVFFDNTTAYDNFLSVESYRAHNATGYRHCNATDHASGGTVFWAYNATVNDTFPQCYRVSGICAASCIAGSKPRMVSSVCGGVHLPGTAEQCSVQIKHETNVTVHDYGAKGTHTHNIHTITTSTWFAEAANGRRWELNRTTVQVVVHPICPSRNGLLPGQISDVADWVMGWADHPIVHSSVQKRWWQSKNSSSYDNERGFELHIVYPGEEFMSMEVKPQINVTEEQFWVEIPAAAAAYLWDIRNDYSFLNHAGMKKWENVIRHTQNWSSIAQFIPGDYSDGLGGPGTIPSGHGSLMVNDAKPMKAIATWLKSWAVHPFLQNTLQRQWRRGHVIDASINYRLTEAPTAAPTVAPTKAPTTATPTATPTAAQTTNVSAGRRLIVKSFNELNSVMAEQYKYLLDENNTYYQIETEGTISNHGLYLQRQRPSCTDVDPTTAGCQGGFELDPTFDLYQYEARNESIPNSTQVLVNADVGEEVSRILWDPADKRSFLHPDGFVAWTQGIANCTTSIADGRCADVPALIDVHTGEPLGKRFELDAGEVCNVHEQCAVSHFCAVRCKSGVCKDTVNVCQPCDQCKSEADGIDGACAMHCKDSPALADQRRAAATEYLRKSLGIRTSQVVHIRDNWLRMWLDNPVLIASDDLLGAYNDEKVVTITDLAYSQFGNATVTKKTFIPEVGHTWKPVLARMSAREITSRKYFAPGKEGSAKDGVAAEEAVVPPLGYHEFSAFTHFGSAGQMQNHQQFGAGDSTLNLEYSKRLLDLFTDPRDVSASTAAASLHMSKGMLAIQSYIDQPYRTSSDCESASRTLSGEFPAFETGDTQVQETTEEVRMSDGSIRIVVSVVTGLCSQFADGYWAPRLFFKNTTATTASEKEALRAYMFDLKQYLKYAGTKFEYEPRILNRGGGYFTTQTAGDLLVTGYRDPLVSRLREEKVTALVPNQHPQLELPSTTSPEFSLFHNYTRQHAEVMGPRKVHAGDKQPYSDYLERFNNLEVWNGQQKINLWTGENVPVSGTDGSQFAPILSAKSSTAKNSLTVWSSEAVRPFSIDYVQDVTRYGIDLRRYKIKNLNRFSLTTDERTPLNLIDLKLAHKGLPMSMSYPHFLNGIVKTIRDGVEGLNPVEYEHETIYDVDPVSGMTMNKKRRWQMNLQVRATETWHRDTLVPHCERAEDQVDSDCMLYLPVYWVDERGAILAKDAYAYKDDIYAEFSKRAKVPVASFYGGALLLSISFILLVLAVRHKEMVQVMPQKNTASSNKVAQKPSTAAVAAATGAKSKKTTPSKALAQKNASKLAKNSKRFEVKQAMKAGSKKVARGAGEKGVSTKKIARGGGESVGQGGNRVAPSGKALANSPSRGKIQRGAGEKSGSLANSPSRGKIQRGAGEKSGSLANSPSRGKIQRGAGEKSGSLANSPSRGKIQRGAGEKTVKFQKIDV